MRLFGLHGYASGRKALSIALSFAFVASPFVPLFSFPATAFASTVGDVISFDTIGSNSWTVPADVASVKVTAWGGGGAGGSQALGIAGQGGGAGGYAQDTVSVVPGSTHAITVGAGGTAAGSSRNGGSSSFDSSVAANGGTGGANGDETLAGIGRVDTQCSFDGTWVYNDQGGGNDFAVTCRNSKITGFCNTSGTAAGLSRGLHAGDYTCEMGVTPELGTKCDFDGTWSYDDEGGGNDFAITCRTGKVTGYCGATSLTRGNHPGDYTCEYGQSTLSAPRCNFDGSWSYNDEGGGNDFAMTCRNGYMAGWCGATPLQRGGPQTGNYACAPVPDAAPVASAFTGAGGAGTAGSDLQNGGSAAAVSSSLPTDGGSAANGGAGGAVSGTLDGSAPGGGGAGSATGNGGNGGQGRVTIQIASLVSSPADAVPQGFIDGADCNQFAGWAYDPDASSTPIMVHFYADGPAGSGTFLGAVLASTSRPDVNSVAGIPGDHGFVFPTPMSLRDNQAHKIYAYGINTDPAGQNTDLQTSGPVQNDFAAMSACAPVDNPPNGLSVSGPVAGTTNVPYSFSASAVDPEGSTVRYGFDWDGNGSSDEFTGFVASAATTSISHSWPAVGRYTFQVYAFDSTAGNQSAPVPHTIDISAPVASSTISSVSMSVSPSSVAIQPGGNVQVIASSTASVAGTASLTNHGIEMRVNGGAWSNAGAWPSPVANTVRTSDASFTALDLSSGGTYDFRAYASIDNGASYTYSNVATVSVTVNVPVPALDSVSVSATPSSIVIPIGGSVPVSVSSTAATSNGAALTNHGIEMRVNGGAWSNAGAWPSPVGNTLRTSDASFAALSLSSAGTYDFRAYGSIDGGASYVYSSPATVTAAMSANHAPVISSVVGPASGLVNTSYVFTATATDQDGDAIQYGFDWNDNGVIDAGESWAAAVASGTPVGRSNIWTTNGAHPFQVLARDSNGAVSSFPATIDISGGASNIGFAIATSSSGFFTSESGSTAVFTVVLDSAPLAAVTLPVRSSDFTEGTTSVTSLTFMPSAWNVPQTVTITGVDDLVLDGNIAYSVVVGPSSSADVNYNGLPAQSVSLVNFDNEVAPAGGGAISSFALNPSSITSGGTSTLSWTATNSTSCVASGAWSGNQNSASGSVVVGPYAAATSTFTNTYVIACGNANGTTTQSAILTVNPAAASSTPAVAPVLSSSSGSGHGGGYSGPCIGNGCAASAAVAPAASDVMILIDRPAAPSAPSIPHPPKACVYSDFITTYLRKGIENNPNEVKKLQYFLNTYDKAGLAMNGTFDQATEDAVKAFQSAHAGEVLSPWGTDVPTGIVYITTTAAINRIFCGDNPTYKGDNDIKDIINPVLYTPVDNSSQFQNVVGSATTSTSTNIASVFGAISGDIGQFLKGVPWYEIILLLILLLGSGFIVQGIFKKDILSPANAASLVQGITALAIGSVLNVLNTLSYMISPDWFSSHIGMNPSWLLGLDAVNIAAVAVICLALLAAIYRKLALSSIK